MRVWLPPEQAERLAADILSARFDLQTLLIIHPRKKRSKPAYIVFRSAPRVLGNRPHDFSAELLAKLTPAERVKAQAGRKREQEQWDIRYARSKEGKQAKTGSRLFP
jgi:hypothetical protein